MGKVFWLVLLVACGNVDKKEKADAAISDAPADSPPDAMRDAGVDAGLLCMNEGFDGTALSASWTVVAGAAPTYTVDNSKISFTDAPYSPTPSNPNNTESWINDYAMDLGNQLGWSHAIGTGDFTVRSHIDWTSDNNQLMIAGVAVTDATSHIIAWAGAIDSQQGELGSTVGAIASLNAYLGTYIDPGTADLRIQRIGGTLKVFIDNVEVVTSPNDTSSISYVSLVAVRYRLNANEYEFGTADLTFVEVCK